MIKLLFSGKEILIVSLVFILLVNATNLTFPNAVDEKTIMDWGNTVEATDDSYTIKHLEERLDEYWKEQEKDMKPETVYGAGYLGLYEAKAVLRE